MSPLVLASAAELAGEGALLAEPAAPQAASAAAAARARTAAASPERSRVSGLWVIAQSFPPPDEPWLNAIRRGGPRLRRGAGVAAGGVPGGGARQHVAGVVIAHVDAGEAHQRGCGDSRPA